MEFRFRHRMLERYGITTFKDLKNSQAALPKVFGRDWFRILERDKVRDNENEIPDDLRQTPKIQRVTQVDRLVKQAAGLLSAAASCVCEKSPTSKKFGKNRPHF